MASRVPFVVAALVLVPLAGGARATAERVCGRPYPPAPAIRVPSGFRAEIFAAGLHRPTALAYGPGRRLYATQESGEVVEVGAGTCRPRTLLRNLPTPLGLTWVGNRLYVSAQGRVESVLVIGGIARDPHRVLSHLPFGEHQQDNIVLGPDGRLYVGNGSTCDVCRERDRRSATILSFRPGGGDLRIVAKGLRNPYGLAFRPGTNDLYVSVNGQDKLDRPGDPEPAETVVRIRPGADYGWPRCWPSARLLRLAGRCAGVTAPAAYLEPHSSADGLAFYGGTTFPAAYRGDLFVAEWGQYLSKRFGRRVVRVDLAETGARSKVSVFADGFRHPLAVAVDGRGALLVADYDDGRIYRIQASGKP